MPRYTTTDRSRRRFIRHAATGITLGAAPWFAPASALGKDGRPAPSNRVTMGMIGCGNNGTNGLKSFLTDARVQVIAVCDVNRQSPGYWANTVRGRRPALATVQNHYAARSPGGTYAGCDEYEDFREMLARPDIDAVQISTPDHWHAIMAVAAARAGKDIYGQKPLALTVAEGRAIADAVRRYNVVFQTGSQQRSNYHCRRVCELVRNGRIGKLHTVRVGLPSGTPDVGRTGHLTDPMPAPEGFDYDMWLGPAPEAAYCPARTHVNFRWVLDYSGGQLTDWGGHHPDIAQWGMGTDDTGPVKIANATAEYADHPIWNTATQFYFEAIYAGGVKMIVSTKERFGITFEGAEGRAWAGRRGHEVSRAHLQRERIGPGEIHLYESDDHYRNFIDCVLTRERTAAPAEVAHRSITIAHLGNIAMKLGRDLHWDPETEQIADDPTASRMLSRAMREPWAV